LEKKKGSAPLQFGEEEAKCLSGVWRTGREVPQHIFRYFKLMYIYDSIALKSS